MQTDVLREVTDQPFLYWPDKGITPNQDKYILRALSYFPNITGDLKKAIYYRQLKPQTLKMIIKLLEERFHGDDNRTELLANYYENTGDEGSARKIVQESIDSGSDALNTYTKAGMYDIYDNNYDKALKLFLSHPSFKKKKCFTSRSFKYRLRNGEYFILER